jgi:hypothetical protein
MGNAGFTKVPPKSQYLRLAEECDKQAETAKTEMERRDYRSRAALWRKLGNARLETNKPASTHFSGANRLAKK